MRPRNTYQASILTQLRSRGRTYFFTTLGEKPMWYRFSEGRYLNAALRKRGCHKPRMRRGARTCSQSSYSLLAISYRAKSRGTESPRYGPGHLGLSFVSSERTKHISELTNSFSGSFCILQSICPISLTSHLYPRGSSHSARRGGCSAERGWLASPVTLWHFPAHLHEQRDELFKSRYRLLRLRSSPHVSARISPT